MTDATSKARASWGSSNDARSENHEHPTAASPEGNGSSGSSSQERCVATADGNSPRHQTAPAPENFRKRSYSDGEVDGIAHGRESEGLAGRKRHRSRTLLRYLNSLGCDDPWSAYNQRFDSTDDAKSLEDAMEPEL